MKIKPLIFSSLLLAASAGVYAQEKSTDPIINILPDGAPKQLSPMAMGVNTQCRKGPSWDDKSFLDRIATLHLQNIRYPGGTIGDFWDWRTGMLIQQNMRDPKHPVEIPKGSYGITKKINRYTLDDFKKALDRSPGAQAVFMLNMLTDNLESQIEMLRYARKIGIPVRYVEFGNEYYLSYWGGGSVQDNRTGYYTEIYPTAADYAKECVRWTKALRAEFPGIKVAIIAQNYDGNEAPWLSHPRSQSWNHDIMEANTGVDAAIVHLYTDSRRAASPAQSFYFSKKRMDENAEYLSRELSGMPVWFTEFNIKSSSNRYECAWIMALHTIFQICETMLIPQVEFVCYHNLTAEYQIALIFNEKTNVPIKRGGAETVEVQPLELSVSGYGYRFLGEAMVGSKTLQRLQFEGVPTIKVENTTMPLVWGYAIQSAKAEKVILNLSDQPQTIACGKGVNNVRSATAAALDLVITNQKQITYSNAKADPNGNVTVPPRSMNLIVY